MMPLPDHVPSDELMALLEAEAQGAEWFFSMNAPLLARERTGDIQAGWLMTAFDYDLRWRAHNRQEPPFGSMIEAGGSRYPMALPDVPDEVVALWANVLDRSSHPLLRARLGHLLFCRGEGRRGGPASAAYLELASGGWEPIHRVECFDWAFDLARRTRDTKVINEALAALTMFAVEEMNSPDSGPGVTLFASRLLIENSPDNPVIASLLAEGRRRYSGDQWLTSSVIELERLVAPDEEARRALDRQEVETLLDNAVIAQGIVRMAFLTDAAKRAADLGVTDLLAKARTELQNMKTDDLGLQTFSASMELPVDEIEAHISAIVEHNTLAEALGALISQQAPSGDVETNRETVGKLMADHPLQALFRAVRLRPDGMPQYQATSDEEHQEQQLADYETNLMSVTGQIHGEALRRILEKFDPSEDQLRSIMPPHPDNPNVKAMARALGHFHGGDWEAAAFGAMPRIEAILRDHLRAAGEPIFTPQKGRTRGQYAQLGALLAMMEGRIDPSWRRFLVTFLTSEWGPNYRNELLHGFVDEVGPTNAALVLIAALSVLVRVNAPNAGGSEPTDDSPAPAPE